MVHRPRVENLDADVLSWNPCISHNDEVDEDMMISWHTSILLCLLRGDSNIEALLTSYFSQRVDDHSSDLDIEDGVMDKRDIHNDALVLKFLRTSMVPDTVGAKERDRVHQRAKRYRLEEAHVLRVWEDGKIQVVPHPAEKALIVRHAREELRHFGVKRTYSLLIA